MRDNNRTTKKNNCINNLPNESGIAQQVEQPQLQNEIEKLRNTIQHMKTENLQLENKYRESEKRNTNLASLYVTSFLLHSSYDYDHVMQSISEVVINLIGSECFGIYLYSSIRNSFLLASGKCLEDNLELDEISTSDSLLNEIMAGGKMVLNPSPANADFSHPVAIVPLRAMEEIVGVLIVYTILTQKKGQLETMDIELLDLLEVHAGLAIKSSQLHSMSVHGKISSLQ